MQARLYMDVIANVTIVVIVDKWMMTDRVVQRECGDYKQQAQNEGLPRRRKGQGSGFFKGRQPMNLITPDGACGITRQGTCEQ